MKSVTLTIVGLTHALLGATSELSSKCENDQLVLEIPYTISSASSLLGFTAGICNVNHITTGEVRFDHDVSSELATVTVDINACNLAAELYDVPISVRSLYKATAYVSIGVRDDVAGVEYIYYSATIATECGAQTKYQIDFAYGEIKSRVPDNVNPDTCQKDTAGNCIIPAYEAYNFNFDEYTSETYSTKADATTKQQTAGSVIYLQISSSDITSTKKFAIEQCTVKTNSGDSLTIFDGATSCTNDFIALSVVYTENSIQISHRLFQYGANAHSSYTLSCDLEVCDKSAGNSNCNALATSCMASRTGDVASFETYMCNDFCVAGGGDCSIKNSIPTCGPYNPENLDDWLGKQFKITSKYFNDAGGALRYITMGSNMNADWTSNDLCEGALGHDPNKGGAKWYESDDCYDSRQVFTLEKQDYNDAYRLRFIKRMPWEGPYYGGGTPENPSILYDYCLDKYRDSEVTSTDNNGNWPRYPYYRGTAMRPWPCNGGTSRNFWLGRGYDGAAGWLLYDKAQLDGVNYFRIAPYGAMWADAVIGIGRDDTCATCKYRYEVRTYPTATSDHAHDWYKPADYDWKWGSVKDPFEYLQFIEV